MHLIGVTGKPAAGKSFVAEKVGAKLDCPVIEMGDIVEERVADYFNVSVQELKSDQKGEGATKLREEQGQKVFARATLDKCQRVESATCVISGVRTPNEIEVFSSETFDLVLVTAPFETRYQRFISRGREDEADFSRDQFEKRNQRELDWGLNEVINNSIYDVELSNDGSVSDLDAAVGDLVVQLGW